jgi:hypothetical protein
MGSMTRSQATNSVSRPSFSSLLLPFHSTDDDDDDDDVLFPHKALLLLTQSSTAACLGGEATGGEWSKLE